MEFEGFGGWIRKEYLLDTAAPITDESSLCQQLMQPSAAKDRLR